MRTCSKCGELKKVSEFNKKRSGYQAMCRLCQRAYYASYYRDNEKERTRIRKKNAAQKAKSMQYVIDYLSSHPCVDCGENDVIVLQFDHLRDKSFSVTTKAQDGLSIDKLEAEIAKCEVRCANCHIRRHAKEQGTRKYVFSLV